MGVMRPELVMKSIVPVVMAGVLGIYGLIIAVIISTGVIAPGGEERRGRAAASRAHERHSSPFPPPFAQAPRPTSCMTGSRIWPLAWLAVWLAAWLRRLVPGL